jgi:hypothetical protein
MMAPRDPSRSAPRVDISASEFHQLFTEVVNWDRWDVRPELGALHYITAERIAAAARLVDRG